MSGARQYACLIGNGLSTAYNTELSVEKLTEGLVARFDRLAGTSVGETLRAFASSLTGNASEQFESLLSPLESAGKALPYLAELTPLASAVAPTLRESVDDVAGFCREVHRLGLGTALSIISSAGTGQGEATFNRVIRTVCSQLADLNATRNISVATLNYDGLLHAGFLTLEQQRGDANLFCDLASGYLSAELAPVGSENLPCLEIRGGADLPRSRRIHLLNLHGSLSWLEDLDTRRIWKFELDDLRRVSYWQHLTDGTVVMTPVVILTDRKTEAVDEWPFSLAYSIFENRLFWADRWLIAGYGFGDEPVNALFKRTWQRLAEEDRPRPKILVIGREEPVEELRDLTATKLNFDRESVSADSSGLPEAVTSPEWEGWAA